MEPELRRTLTILALLMASTLALMTSMIAFMFRSGDERTLLMCMTELLKLGRALREYAHLRGRPPSPLRRDEIRSFLSWRPGLSSMCPLYRSSYVYLLERSSNRFILLCPAKCDEQRLHVLDVPAELEDDLTLDRLEAWLSGLKVPLEGKGDEVLLRGHVVKGRLWPGPWREPTVRTMTHHRVKGFKCVRPIYTSGEGLELLAVPER